MEAYALFQCALTWFQLTKLNPVTLALMAATAFPITRAFTQLANKLE